MMRITGIRAIVIAIILFYVKYDFPCHAYDIGHGHVVHIVRPLTQLGRYENSILRRLFHEMFANRFQGSMPKGHANCSFMRQKLDRKRFSHSSYARNRLI